MPNTGWAEKPGGGKPSLHSLNERKKERERARESEREREGGISVATTPAGYSHMGVTQRHLSSIITRDPHIPVSILPFD